MSPGLIMVWREGGNNLCTALPIDLHGFPRDSASLSTCYTGITALLGLSVFTAEPHREIAAVLVLSVIMTIENGGRGGEKEGYFKMHKVESYPKDTSEKGSAFTTEFDWTARGESITSSIQYFKPPCLTGYTAEPPDVPHTIRLLPSLRLSYHTSFQMSGCKSCWRHYELIVLDMMNTLSV